MKYIIGLTMFLIIAGSWYTELQPRPVYACSSDKDELPTQIQIQCKRMTRGQWWHR